MDGVGGGVARDVVAALGLFRDHVDLGAARLAGLARAVRAKVLSLRDEDYVVAAELLGASRVRVLFRHMLPNFSGHLIASVTLAVPGMILGETALSFLGWASGHRW